MPHLQLHSPQMQQQRLRLSLRQKMRKMMAACSSFPLLVTSHEEPTSNGSPSSAGNMRAKVAQNSTASNSHANGQVTWSGSWWHTMERKQARHRAAWTQLRKPVQKSLWICICAAGATQPPSYLKCTKRPTAKLCMPYGFLVIAAWAIGLWSKLASATLQTV